MSKPSSRRRSQHSELSTQYWLLTAFGPDHPGMVAQLTRAVFKHGGTIEDTSMTRLGGEFSMMLVIGLPLKASKSLVADVPRELSLNLKPIQPKWAHARPSQATHLISIYGTDRPGIVYQTAEILTRRRINITDLNTRVLKRSGKSLYVMLLEIQIASKTVARAVEKDLKKLGKSLHLDVTLQRIDPISL